ncbi:MAG: DUF3619 family protein [Herminiimonas sp.]|nr:DUF3619 family protein [Herminiimonas sp.]
MNAKQQNYAYRVRHALDQNLDRLPAATTDRLAAARMMALARRKQDSPMRVPATQPVAAFNGGGFFSSPLSWLGRVGMAVPLVVLAIGIVGIYQAEQQYRISETADIDVAVLSDELPLTAYLDHGFNAFLAKRMD